MQSIIGLINIERCKNIDRLLHTLMKNSIILLIISFICTTITDITNIPLYICSFIFSINNIIYVLFLRKQSKIIKEINRNL